MIKDQGSGLALNFQKAIWMIFPFPSLHQKKNLIIASSFSLVIDDGENTTSKGEVKQFDFVGE